MNTKKDVNKVILMEANLMLLCYIAFTTFR